MELTEPIDKINKRLRDNFGIDTISGNTIWRVVWSDDQFEKRLTNCTAEGLTLLTPIVREFPKYKQWIQQRYILERFVIVPALQQNELADVQVSYEPLWTFEDKNGNYLPPKWEACEFIIQAVYAVQFGRNKGIARYIDPDIAPDARIKRIDNIMEQLWGDESSLMLGTVAGDTVAGFYPSKDIQKKIITPESK